MGFAITFGDMTYYNTINDAVTMAGGAEGALLAGRYHVVWQLGAGGMGSVWLAEDTQLDNKQFAIKMLPSILVSNKRAYRQLKDEALVAMKLTHPNIVTLRAFEENNGNPFLVMDYIDGGTLDDYLADKGKLSEDEAVRILKPIAAALDYAHSKGVVHRDVKPGNVMIAKDGTPYILDFGIAREIQETMTRVTGKLSSGTLLYMSPEQLHGAAPKKEQDIYSFAAMAYECLKGEPPFSRGQIEFQIDNDMPEPLPGGPRSVAAAIMSGLAKKPEDRPATCAAVLEGKAINRVEHVERVEGDGRARRPAEPGVPRSRAAVKGILAAALIAVLAGGAWWLGGRNGTTVSTPKPIPSKEHTEPQIVQLWENGPYWADRNIGAENPEDYGLYFWWGDTVGYKRVGNAWVASDGSSSNFSFGDSNTPTYNKSIATLKDGGWITAEGVLAPAHDAAHVHWGGGWRMPTYAEFSALINNCTTTWKTRHGVYGWLVTGKGAYADRSIFLPAAGYGDGSCRIRSGSYGFYWSSTPYSDNSHDAWNLYFSGYFRRGYFNRYNGRSVRPVRGFADADATNASAKSQFNLATKESAQKARVERVDDVDAFKEKAERNLVPSLTIVAKVGESIADGAKVRIDGAENNTPFEWKNLTKGTRMGPYNVSYESGGKLYYGTFDAVTVDWTGPREISVAMKEYTGPRKVQLWEGGPYWADRNIGAERPEDYGYYFWWGDIVGYKHVNGAWLARDGSSSCISFDKANTPTYGEASSQLREERWITEDGVLAPEHDAAHVQWGGVWRMPTQQEIEYLNSKCVWKWKTVKGVKGYEVRGKGAYASKSIFLPCAGYGNGTSLFNAGSDGNYWSSVPDMRTNDSACGLDFHSGGIYTSITTRFLGQSVRPVQGFTK